MDTTTPPNRAIGTVGPKMGGTPADRGPRGDEKTALQRAVINMSLTDP